MRRGRDCKNLSRDPHPASGGGFFLLGLELFDAPGYLRVVFAVFFVLFADEGVEGEEAVVELGAGLGAVVDALGEGVHGVGPGLFGGGDVGFGLEEFRFGG